MKLRTSLFLLSFLLCSHLQAEPVATAKALIAELNGASWTYGSDLANKKINCVLFVVKVLEKELNRALTAPERTSVLIAGSHPELQSDIVAQKDYTKGVAQAITSATLINKGITIAVADAKAGDFVQYWYKDGTSYKGHSGVVSKAWRDNANHIRIALLGAHEHGGITDKDFGGSGLDLNDAKYFVYLARLTP